MTCQFWEREHVYSGGSADKPAQPHGSLNRGIKKGLSLLREAINLEECWPVLPLSLYHPWGPQSSPDPASIQGSDVLLS